MSYSVEILANSSSVESLGEYSSPEDVWRTATKSTLCSSITETNFKMVFTRPSWTQNGCSRFIQLNDDIRTGSLLPMTYSQETYGKKGLMWIIQCLVWCNKICCLRTRSLFLAFGRPKILYVSWCFCQAFWFKLNDDWLNSIAKSLIIKTDLKWLKWTQQKMNLVPVICAAGRIGNNIVLSFRPLEMTQEKAHLVGRCIFLPSAKWWLKQHHKELSECEKPADYRI